MILYTPPKIGSGFNAMVAYAPSEAPGNTLRDGAHSSVKLGYQNGPLSLDVAYGKTTLAAASDFTTSSIGGWYVFGAVKPMFQVSQDKLGAAGATCRERGYMLGGHVPVAPRLFRFSWARVNRTSDTATEGVVKQLSIGYVHNLSGRAALHAASSMVKNSNHVNSLDSGYSVGMGARATFLVAPAQPPRPQRRVRSATLLGYEDAARAAGLDAGRMLAAAGLAPPAAVPLDTPISASAACRLLEDSARACGIEHFGLSLSGSRGLDILGPLSLAMREEPTLRAALRSMQRYLALHSEAVLLEIEQTPGALVIRESLMVEYLGSTRQADEMVVGSLFRLLRELVGAAWRPRRVCFSHAAPGDLAAHWRAFGLTPEFGCDFNGIVCTPVDLDATPAAHAPRLGPGGRSQLDSLLARSLRTMTEQVTRLVRTQLAGGRCGVDDVAACLGVDRRTVHRRLAREGTTFSRVLAEVRTALAVQYLSVPTRPVSYVGELLGFALPSAFTHWFRREFGCSPATWRARQLTGARATLRALPASPA